MKDRLHAGEARVDERLVRALLRDQLPRLAALPLRRARRQGTDNVVFRLGDDLAVRLPRTQGAVAGLEAELDGLPRVAPGLPLAVPEPVVRGEPGSGHPFPWAVVRWVPGATPAGRDLLDTPDNADRLAAFVTALSAADTTGGTPAGDHEQRAGVLGHFTTQTLASLDEVAALQAEGRVAAGLLDPARARQVWSEACAAPRWSGAPTWSHRDLYADNLLVDDAGRLVGVIDFGGLVVGEPAGDAMAAWHLFDGARRERFLAAIGADTATRLRARGWVLRQGLLALAYYLDRHPGMVAMATRAIGATLEAPIDGG